MTAVIAPTPVGIAAAALLIGTGIGICTPIASANLAAAAPDGRVGQTMGAGEVGRELGDAGGPILVGAFSPVGLGAGRLALAAVISLGAATSWRLTGADVERVAHGGRQQSLIALAHPIP